MNAFASGLAAPPAAQSLAQRRALWFTAAILAVSLVLQRFGVPFGGKQLSIVGPIGLALAAWGLFSGALAFHRGRLVTYLALFVLLMVGMVRHAADPGGFGEGVNTNSLAQFLILTAFATLTFAEPVDETAFFHLVTFALMLVAVAGILEFFAQFAGLRVFAFTGLLPDKILFEEFYNVEIPVGTGDMLKSNGFVLVEPSVFSQLMAVGLIIEAVSRRRLGYLAAFVAGLLLSFSGTGWIVLAAFVLGSAVVMGWRGLLIAGGVVGALGMVLVAAYFLAPDIVETIGSRLDEISRPSTSGHLRFITPFWMLHDVLSRDSLAWLLGIGSGGSERLILPYDYNVNTPVKVTVEYGLPALIAYVLLFVLGRKSPVQAAVVFPAVVLFFFTGGYQQFPPMVFIVLLLTAVARLRATKQPVALPADARQPRAGSPANPAASAMGATPRAVR